MSRACWQCAALLNKPQPPVALWTWQHGGVDVVCQQHLDDCLDYADNDPVGEPARVQWLDGSRTLVAA